MEERKEEETGARTSLKSQRARARMGCDVRGHVGALIAALVQGERGVVSMLVHPLKRKLVLTAE